MAFPQPSVRPLAPPQRGNASPERAATASPQTILAEQLEITHRAAMSGMASVADWSDALRAPEMATGGKENYSAMISRLSQSLTRMMAEVAPHVGDPEPPAARRNRVASGRRLRRGAPENGRRSPCKARNAPLDRDILVRIGNSVGSSRAEDARQMERPRRSIEDTRGPMGR
jgi:hypothetical protein